MTRIAFLISGDMVAGHAQERGDQYEFELEFAELEPACRAQGYHLEPVVWDSGFDASQFTAIVIGTAWDYTSRPEKFLRALGDWESQCRVLNSSRTAEWNMDKRYLQALSEAGIPVIDTVWADRADETAITQAFATLDCDEIVVKPLVGAGAWRQARIKRADPLPPAENLPPREAMIQPFLPSIAEEGEYSLIFFEGSFSHAVLKRPRSGDYRVQSVYGGVEQTHTATPDQIAVASDILAAARELCGEPGFLYARVDMARGLDGLLKLMELELIEPYLYPEQGPGMGARFAQALKARLG